MKHIPQYNHYQRNSAKEFRVDVVNLHYIKPYFQTDSIHTLGYYEVSFISEGSGFFTVGDQTHIVKPRDVVFTRPGETRNWDNRNIRNGFALIFDEEFVSSFFNDPEFLRNLSFFSIGRYSVKITLSDEAYIRLYSILSYLGTAIREARESHTVRSLLYEVLVLLNQAYLGEHNVLPVLPEASKMVNNKYVDNFLRLVNAHYMRQHSISYYAERLSISPNYLNGVIKKSIGINAKLYIQNRIVQEAKRMLVYTDMPVASIADALSFENPSYFIRFFRSHTRYTPLQYRNLSR
jgi:AraC-like DNA-binding protein